MAAYSRSPDSPFGILSAFVAGIPTGAFHGCDACFTNCCSCANASDFGLCVPMDVASPVASVSPVFPVTPSPTPVSPGNVIPAISRAKSRYIAAGLKAGYLPGSAVVDGTNTCCGLGAPGCTADKVLDNLRKLAAFMIMSPTTFFVVVLMIPQHVQDMINASDTNIWDIFSNDDYCSKALSFFSDDAGNPCTNCVFVVLDDPVSMKRSARQSHGRVHATKSPDDATVIALSLALDSPILSGDRYLDVDDLGMVWNSLDLPVTLFGLPDDFMDLQGRSTKISIAPTFDRCAVFMDSSSRLISRDIGRSMVIQNKT